MQVYVNECYNIEDQANSCYLHPDETLVGVCHLCLNERLIILASLSKQSMYCLHRRSFNFCSEENGLFGCGYSDKKPALQKIFSLGSGIFRGQNKLSSDHFPAPNQEFDDSVSTSSQEDSYISFKIEDNGLASWEKDHTGDMKQRDNKTVDDSKDATEPGKQTKHYVKETVAGLENPKHKQTERPRWHIRIGQLIKKKGSMRGWGCQVRIDKVVEGVEIRKVGWIRRTLTMRKDSKKD